MKLARIDSKGRISIPSAMRNYLGIEKGDSFIVASGKKNIKLVPMSSNGNVEIEMEFTSINALASAINLLAKNKIKIVSSNSSAGRWHAVLDVQKSERKIIKKISSLRNINYVRTRNL